MKLKMLVILPTLPFPLSSGGAQAIFNGICCLKDSVDLTIVFPVPFYKKKAISCKEIKEKLGNVNVIPFVYNPMKWIDRLINRFLSFFQKKNKKNADFFFVNQIHGYEIPLQRFNEFINSVIEKEKIDIVQLEMFPCLPYVLSLHQNVKKIFVHHELRYVVNELHLNEKGYTEYRKAHVELSYILEIGLLNKYDAIITLSEIDKEKLIKEGVKTPIYPSFAIVNTEKKTFNSNVDGNTLSFVGPSEHSPNYIGVKWFLENCWDKLLQKDASYRLKIIGNWSENKRTEIQSTYKNVEFAGFVPNLADALNNTIMIVPITVGSGIRMKILEAASLGIPFVSTTVGAEGLPFESGKDCLKGDTQEEFVDAILKMRDKSLRVELATKANALVKEKYSMSALRENRLEIYEKVMNGGKS